MITKAKSKAELDAEVPAGGVRFEKDTRVIALKTGYHGVIREAGDVFIIEKGHIMGPNCWFEPVGGNTATREEEDAVEDMTVPELKVALAKRGVDFAGINKKPDLIALYLKSQPEESLA